ncbi:septation protein SepH [Nocardioides sp. AE5]|uniref:septation protein SepH n=1 Tax=Nocardioides sp. AE5 TaxID=2962573 RepID=UPI002881E429|nr:septation protein SepH [Nocardioides sp. AE5]MDT0201374.1 septation protein SepH [Nocardioides sp. AE5]
MPNLSLAGVSEDGKRLLLVSDSGEEFTLAVDAKLRAALRGEHARLGQLEIQMESTLRPRDIQARIRAGDSPESVAQAAHTTVEKILPFANPVLAERAHVAERAQRSSVRRRSGDSGARTLGEAVTAQFSQLGHSSEGVEWDAWRREDNRWTLTATYVAGKRKGTARFTYDMPGNYVTMENDDARWLVGEASIQSAPAKPERDDLQQARQRRLAAVPEEQLPLGDDAISLVTDKPAAEESTVDLTETAEQMRSASTGHEAAEEATLEPTPEPLAEAPQPTPQAEKPAPEPEKAPEPEPAPRKPARKKGRASVPSWDEIMFGGGKQE